MAQKANPYAVRLGYNQDWNTYFFAKNKKEQINWLQKDQAIRNYLNLLFPDTDRLKIEYTKNVIFIYLYIPEISLVLGENNSKLETVMKGIYKTINDDKIAVKINLIEVKNIYTHAQSISNLVASKIKKRVPTRQIIRDLLKEIAKERETKGAKIEIKGRLDESDNSQTKKIVHQKMPLSTIDSNVGFGQKTAFTSYGAIGVKILIYKGKIWQKRNRNYANTEKN